MSENTAENHVAEEFLQFILDDGAKKFVGGDPRWSVKSLTSHRNFCKNSLVSYENTPYEEITRERLQSYNVHMSEAKESLAELNKEKNLLEDYLGKISKMTFSQEGLLEYLVSGLTDKINNKNDRIALHEIVVADCEERIANFDVEKNFNATLKRGQEKVKECDDLILQAEKFNELTNKAHQEFEDQLNS